MRWADLIAHDRARDQKNRGIGSPVSYEHLAELEGLGAMKPSREEPQDRGYPDIERAPF